MRRRVLILAAIVGFCAFFTSGAAALQKLPTDSRDLLRLAAEWWGTPIDQFPAKAGLKAGEFEQADHPDRAELKVVTVEEPVALKKWDPATLPAFEFDFTAGGGLTEIIGFLPGSQPDAVQAITKRYGKATQELTKIPGAITYVWDVGASTLSVAPGFFSIAPKERRP